MHLWTPAVLALSLAAVPAFAAQPATATAEAPTTPWACRELGGMSCEREL
jgi:hypothetical protein